MLQEEMNHLHWIWAVWERVRFGSMGRALEDTGQPLHQMATAMVATTKGHIVPSNARLAVASQHSDGKELNMSSFFWILFLCHFMGFGFLSLAVDCIFLLGTPVSILLRVLGLW